MLAVQYIVLSCNGTCNYALRHRFKLQARYEKCIGPFKGPVNAVIHTKKLYKQILNMAKLPLIQIQQTLFQSIKNQTEGPISPCPDGWQPFGRHDGICNLRMIWAGEVGVKKMAHPPPPPPAPQYTHG